MPCPSTGRRVPLLSAIDTLSSAASSAAPPAPTAAHPSPGTGGVPCCLRFAAAPRSDAPLVRSWGTTACVLSKLPSLTKAALQPHAAMQQWLNAYAVKPLA